MQKEQGHVILMRLVFYLCQERVMLMLGILAVTQQKFAVQEVSYVLLEAMRMGYVPTQK